MALQSHLNRYYHEVLHDPAKVGSFRMLRGGWETEVYFFAEWYQGTVKSRVLRMYPGASAAEKCEREFRGMRQLFDIGYPVPEVFEHSTDPQWLGKPFLTMQYVKSQLTLGGSMMYGTYQHYSELLTRFSRLLVDLHRIDYHSFLWLLPNETEASPAVMLRRKFDDGRRLIIDQFQQVWAFPVFDWLEARLDDVLKTASLSVIHNDFHPYNILLTLEKQACVIDWSLIEVNDYRFDLGWTLVLAARRSLEERNLILNEYERLAGHPVDHIEYFEVIGALRRLFDLSASLSAGADALGMRPDTVVIMRRQHEDYQRVYDLLCEYTGLRLPEIEQLLNTLRGST